MFVIGSVSRGNPLLEAILDAGRPYTSRPHGRRNCCQASGCWPWYASPEYHHGVAGLILERAGLQRIDRRRRGRLQRLGEAHGQCFLRYRSRR